MKSNPTFQLRSILLILMTSVLLLSIVSCEKDIDPAPDPNFPDKMGNLQQLDIELVAQGLTSPLGLEEAPDNSNRLFIYDQIGKIRIVDSSGQLLGTPFLDISSQIVPLMPNYDERGLTGFAFHPNFASNGLFYVYYQAPSVNMQYDHVGRLSEFHASPGSNIANAGSERIVLEWNHPQFNHNGGTVAFGPDGYLYIAIGDGGGANDTAMGHVLDWYLVNDGGNGQDIDSNLLGNILRIDVNGALPYAVPADNPFVGTSHKPEIWAYGMRNPYRFSFDMGGNHRLIAMDAGQNRYEEINEIQKGHNYGWNVKEGDECFNAANGLSPLASCPSVDSLGNPLMDPVIQLKNWLHPAGGGKATTIIAGYVYRGNSLPGYNGKYFFGTFSQTPTTANGELFVAQPNGQTWTYNEVDLASSPGDVGNYLKGFGQDLDGNIYLTVSCHLGPSGTNGMIYKIVDVP
jgi:glucose/arabinose dehydrogenase